MTRAVQAELLTAGQAEAAQERAAGALRSAGSRPGDRVVFCLPSSAALLCAVLGALRTGVVPVLLNATLQDAERDQLIDDADPGLTITDRDRLDDLDVGSPVELAPHPLARPMHYTSGTTGRAKGVWSGLWDPATARAAYEDEADQWSFGPHDVHLVCSPMYHSVSVRFAGGTLLRGGSCIILDRFDAEVATAVLLGRHLEGGPLPVPTTTFMAPSALHRLMDSVRGRSDRFDSLRLLVHAGSPCPPTLKREAMARVGPDVLWEFYGSTEGQFTVCPPDEWLTRPGTVGRARSGRALSVDDDGTIWCRPPDFARFTYWRDEAKTASAWRQGAFTVGDLGRLDADGYLFIDGRRDDLIISGGVNVYPAEVEAVLLEVEGVAEVVVFGRPDEAWGQRVCAAIVPVTALEPESRRRLVAAVQAHAAARLAGYKRPKQVEMVDDLPRTATGKVMRSVLAGRPPP
jgi:long-chain acyl-CoA synthetase